jgi:hypothetical protein
MRSGEFEILNECLEYLEEPPLDLDATMTVALD